MDRDMWDALANMTEAQMMGREMRDPLDLTAFRHGVDCPCHDEPEVVAVRRTRRSLAPNPTSAPGTANR